MLRAMHPESLELWKIILSLTNHEDMTRGVATDVMFNAITGVYFKLVIGLTLLGSLYKFI